MDLFKRGKVKKHYRSRNGKRFLVNPFERKKKEGGLSDLYKGVFLGMGITVLGGGLGTVAFKKAYQRLGEDAKHFVDLALANPKEVTNLANKNKEILKLGFKSNRFNFDSLSIKLDLSKINKDVPSYKEILNIQKQIRPQWEKNLDNLANSLKNGDFEDLVGQTTWVNKKLETPTTPIRALEFESPKQEIANINVSGKAVNIFSILGDNLKEKMTDNVFSKGKGSMAKGTSISTYGSWANIDAYGGINKNPFRPFLDIYERGYDTTSLETAVTAYKTWQKYPDKKIVLTGASSGGWMANDAALILEKAGVPKNQIKLVTFGGEKHLASPEFSNALHLLDDADQLAKSELTFDKPFRSQINWEEPSVKDKWKDLPIMKGHLATVYATKNKKIIRDFVFNEEPNDLIKETVEQVNPTPVSKKIITTNRSLESTPNKQIEKKIKEPDPVAKTNIEKIDIAQKEIDKTIEKLSKLENNLSNPKIPEDKKQLMIKNKENLETKIKELENRIDNLKKLNLSGLSSPLYYLADFFRPLGAKDKKERKKNKWLSDIRTIGDKAIYGGGTGVLGVSLLPFRSKKLDKALQSKHLNKVPFFGKSIREMATEMPQNKLGTRIAMNTPAYATAGLLGAGLGAGYGAYKVLQNRRKNRYD